jgi:hypothetical protein
MRIGIIVGIHTDALDEEHFPDWLLDIPDTFKKMSREKWDKGYYGLGSDIGIAYYIWKLSLNKKKFKHHVDILSKKDVKLSIFNTYDYIIGLYDPYYLAIETGETCEYKRYCSIIQKTTATFLQPLSLQKFVLNKKLYLETMNSKGIPIMDFFTIHIRNNMNANNIIRKIQIKCNEWNSELFITKPQPGGFGMGFKKWNLSKLIKNPNTFKTYLKKMEKETKMEKPMLLIQKFVPEFEIHYEVRTYWLNGIYSHSLGTIIHPKSLGSSGFEEITYAYPKNEYPNDYLDIYENKPDIIETTLMNQLKKMGKKIISYLPKDKTGLPFLLRIDFACCLDNKKNCREYFLNEIEYLPNLFPEFNQHIDVMKKVGQSIIKKIKL